MSDVHKERETKEYGDLTDLQQSILDLWSKGMRNKQAIADEVDCSDGHVHHTLSIYSHFIPTPDYKGTEKPRFAADGGIPNKEPESDENDSNSSVTVQIECDCGEVHEVSIN